MADPQSEQPSPSVSQASSSDAEWELPPPRDLTEGESDDEDVLHLELDGFEGPLDLLLNLARTQKVDLTKISILHLAEQYLNYIEAARELRLEIAADYLVMAAWLAYLKSKLLLPEQEQSQDGGPSGQELAAQLAFRLKRLEAMREALSRLMGRKRLGIDIFSRGLPEGIRVVRSSIYQASIFDLLKAYAQQRSRTAIKEVKWGGREVWSIKQARDRLSKLLGQECDWAALEKFLQDYMASPVELNKTVIASSFGATLELAREGFIEIRQHEPFGPLYIKNLPSPAEPQAQPQ